MRRTLRRPFYGWWIVGAGAATQAIGSGLLQQAFGTYVVLLGKEFGWSRTTLSGAFSLARVEDGLLGPIEGWLLDRFGPRAVMRAGFVLFGAGFFLFARIDTVFEFYATFLIMSVGASMAGFLAITTAVVNWFVRQRSLAMGIALLGNPIGGYALPLVVRALETWGWRDVANASGVIVLVAGLAAAQLVRHRPEQYGLLPDGDPPAAPDDGTLQAGEGDHARGGEVNFTAAQALRTRAFWFISMAHAASVLVVSVTQVHYTAHVVETFGVSLTTAAAMLMLQTTTNFIARPLAGVLSDRVGSRNVIMVAMLMHSVALLLLAFGTTLWTVAAFALLNGAAWGARVPVIVAMRAEYFGARSFGTIMGLSSMAVTVGSVAGPVLAGLSYDITGNYEFGFAALALLAGAGTIFLVFTPPPPAKRLLRAAEPA
ncbi:MAG: MFS transporter [Dehalococcoidia bacterium]|nr:MFS transporter [Dehalococcoidia bacterium]